MLKRNSSSKEDSRRPVAVSATAYKKILAEKHLIEAEYQRTVSLELALDILLDGDQPKWMDQPRVRG